MFDPAAFKESFPQFSAVPDAQLLRIADTAACLLEDDGSDCDARQTDLMVAHLLQLETQEAAGNGQTGQVTSATVGKVTVTQAQLPPRSAWSHWLAMTPYGTQLAAMITARNAGGAYVGGRPERAAFRSVGGRYPRNGRSW